MTLRPFRLSLALTLVALQGYALGPPPPAGITTDNAKVVRVIDGDSLDVLVTYRVRIRLLDCWAEEKHTAAGEKAWEDLEHYIGGKDCVVHIPSGEASSLHEVFTFGRVLGYVWPAGVPESVNEWQIRKGNATRVKGR